MQVELLRDHGFAAAPVRLAFLEAALAHPAPESAAAPGEPPSLPVQVAFPARPDGHTLDYDRPIDTRALLTPDAPWQRRMGGISHSPLKPVTGMAAMRALDDWLASGLDLDGKGFWPAYELLTGALPTKIMIDDSPQAWPSHGRCVAVPWPLRGRCVAVAWAVAWPLRGRDVAVTWPLRGRCVGRCVAVAWPLRGPLRVRRATDRHGAARVSTAGVSTARFHRAASTAL